MKSFILILITFLVPTLLCSQNKLEIIKPNNSKLPINAKYNGNLLEHLRWKDKSGEYIAILSEGNETEVAYEEADVTAKSKKLFGICYSIKDDTLTQKWKVFDQIVNCVFDIDLSFIKNTFQVTDTNNDSIAEVWMMYKLSCTSDASPRDMKIIMYEGKNKFAMRGHNKVMTDETEFEGGDFKFDAAFNKAPNKQREFALKLWNDHILQKWE